MKVDEIDNTLPQKQILKTPQKYFSHSPIHIGGIFLS